MNKNNDEKLVIPGEGDYQDEIENENDMSWENELFGNYPPRSNRLKGFLSGLGTGSLFVSGSIFLIVISILQFIFTALAGLGMIGLAISLFLEGSIILGLLALLIGTPLAIGLAHYAFIFVIILAILTGVLWGIISLFGFDISFWIIWDIIWILIKIFIIGFMVYVGISGFIEAIKRKRILDFFKEFWPGILLFCFLFWLFFF